MFWMEKWTKYCKCGKYINHLDKFNQDGHCYYYCSYCKMYYDSEGNEINFVDKFATTFDKIIEEEERRKNKILEEIRLEEEKKRIEEEEKQRQKILDKQETLINELLNEMTNNYFKNLELIINIGNTSLLKENLDKIWVFIKSRLRKDIVEGNPGISSINNKPLYAEWLELFNRIVLTRILSLEHLLYYVEQFDDGRDGPFDDEMLQCYDLLLNKYGHQLEIVSARNKIKEHLEEKIKARNKEIAERKLELVKLKEQLFTSSDFKETGIIPDSYYLYNYHPRKVWKNGIKIINPLKNDTTDFIISIKNCQKNAIEHIVTKFRHILSNLDKFAICIVPPSDALKVMSGIKLIAKKLSQNGSLDGTDCIIRKRTIPSQHGSNNRLSSENLKASLKIEKEELINGKNILLFDDITTQGNAFESSKQLLLEKGAKLVICIALAKTSYDHNL